MLLLLRHNFTMPETKYLRCTCAQCGGHIEFPAEGIGLTTPCPHCAAETELTFDAPESTSGRSPRSFKWAVAGLVILVVGVAGILGALSAAQKLLKKSRPRPLMTQTLRGPKANSGQMAGVNGRMVLTNGFSVSDVKIEKLPGSTVAYAAGTVENRSDGQRFGVTVELDLLDGSGAKVGTAKDYQGVVEARAEWGFRALLVTKNVASARVSSVREQP